MEQGPQPTATFTPCCRCQTRPTKEFRLAQVLEYTPANADLMAYLGSLVKLGSWKRRFCEQCFLHMKACELVRSVVRTTPDPDFDCFTGHCQRFINDTVDCVADHLETAIIISCNRHLLRIIMDSMKHWGRLGGMVQFFLIGRLRKSACEVFKSLFMHSDTRGSFCGVCAICSVYGIGHDGMTGVELQLFRGRYLRHQRPFPYGPPGSLQPQGPSLQPQDSFPQAHGFPPYNQRPSLPPRGSSLPPQGSSLPPKALLYHLKPLSHTAKAPLYSLKAILYKLKTLFHPRKSLPHNLDHLEAPLHPPKSLLYHLQALLCNLKALLRLPLIL